MAYEAISKMVATPINASHSLTFGRLKNFLIGSIVSKFTLESFPAGDGVEYQVLEIYKHNALLPSYAYHILQRCTEVGVMPAISMDCEIIHQNPTVQPGFVYSFAPAMIQAGGMVGAGALIGSGIRDSKSQTSISQSTSQANSQTNSQRTNTGTTHGGAGNDVITINP